MSHTVLIVDDSVTMRMIVKSIFLELGHWNVITAANGWEALSQAADHPLDLVVTDFHMPGMNGLDFVRSLKRLKSQAEVPVLILSTEEDGINMDRASELGVYAWVHKPVEPETLIDLANEAVAPRSSN